MDESEKDPKIYELSVLLKTEDELPAVVDFLAQHSATLQGEMKAKKQAFAYPVKKIKEGVFAYCLFTALPESAKTIEKDITRQPNILRSLIIAEPPAAEKRSPMPPDFAARRRMRPSPRPTGPAPAPAIPRPESSTGTLSNEALEKKIEEILK